MSARRDFIMLWVRPNEKLPLRKVTHIPNDDGLTLPEFVLLIFSSSKLQSFLASHT